MPTIKVCQLKVLFLVTDWLKPIVQVSDNSMQNISLTLHFLFQVNMQPWHFNWRDKTPNCISKRPALLLFSLSVIAAPSTSYDTQNPTRTRFKNEIWFHTAQNECRGFAYYCQRLTLSSWARQWRKQAILLYKLWQCILALKFSLHCFLLILFIGISCSYWWWWLIIFCRTTNYKHYRCFKKGELLWLRSQATLVGRGIIYQSEGQ